ncbi:MAG: ATPase [uncultured Sulfurovum sp.]|uniref:ATPase n=1 Tax=uncultured Sulfurovum sp. TaxID=269237 RepID=A0A6S6TLK1_9BACT|nr:MAG: ATPase [uncultured Sulfurovum sp.]
MKNILIEQNLHWNKQLSSSIRREQLTQLIDYLPLRQVITISGIRRCGKSTLAKQAINHLLTTGVNPYNILFVNLEQPYFLEYKHDANYLNTIYDEYLKLANPQGKTYVIFDEVQFFENWQVFIKSKYESSDIKFIITGSNSSLLSNDLNTLLSGRTLGIHLETFSFKEFLDYKQITYSNEIERISNRIAIARAKEEYLKWGGFYEVFDEEQEYIKKEILIAYAKNIIYQDIVPRYGIRNSSELERLFFYLLSTATGILNYSKLAETFNISDKSIKEYIGYFEEVFLLKRMDRYHTKPKEKIRSSKKIYVNDNGFLQIAPKHSKNLGTALENKVFNVLYANDNRVTYRREKHEVDFYSQETLYQVAYDIEDEKTRKRELGAFKYFKDKDIQVCKLITFDTNEVVEGIEVLSFDEFVLGKN